MRINLIWKQDRNTLKGSGYKLENRHIIFYSVCIYNICCCKEKQGGSYVAEIEKYPYTPEMYLSVEWSVCEDCLRIHYPRR